MKKKRILIFLALLALLLLAASPLAPDIVIDWWAIGPGSARLANAGTELHGMLGQGAAGQVSQAGTELCAGYLCLPTGLTLRVQLPLILK
jgi:hypothetical protein